MKKILLLFTVSLLFFSCDTSKYLINSSYVDYSAITDGKDLFITESNSVSFEYKALGSITVECISGDTNTMDANDFPVYKIASIEDAFKELIKIADSKRANGVINVQSHFFSAYSIGNVTYQSRWIVTGMLIKK
jgi:hypothetical protein